MVLKAFNCGPELFLKFPGSEVFATSVRCSFSRLCEFVVIRLEWHLGNILALMPISSHDILLDYITIFSLISASCGGIY